MAFYLSLSCVWIFLFSKTPTLQPNMLTSKIDSLATLVGTNFLLKNGESANCIWMHWIWLASIQSIRIGKTGFKWLWGIVVGTRLADLSNSETPDLLGFSAKASPALQKLVQKPENIWEAAVAWIVDFRGDQTDWFKVIKRLKRPLVTTRIWRNMMFVILQWPPQSSDYMLIEHPLEIHMTVVQATNVHQLHFAIMSIWSKIWVMLSVPCLTCGRDVQS